MGRPLIDIAGKKFNSLFVLRRAMPFEAPNRNEAYWVCLCDCGQITIDTGSHVRHDYKKTCSCRNKFAGDGGREIRLLYANEYNIWQSIWFRCTNRHGRAYKNYGGRGITVHLRWRSFKNFLCDMGPRPSKNHSIERRNNSLGYSKDNCYWATRKEQSRNTRRTRMITYQGKTMCINDWAKHTGIARKVIARRLDKKWPIDDVFSTQRFYGNCKTTRQKINLSIKSLDEG
jgi:hypothetical protein